MNAAAKRRLREAAWISLVVHAAAGAAMLFVLRRGLATNPDLSDRMRFVAESLSSWRLAWASWNLAAFSILYYFARMAGAHADDGPSTARWCRRALVIGIAAVVFDLSAEMLMMFVLPLAARAGDVERFLFVDRAAVLLTGFLANLLYTAGAAILALATRRSYPSWTWGAGAAASVAGALLSVSALTGSITGLFWTNAMLVPLLTLWQFGVALASSSAARRADVSGASNGA
jgi:hypothetical protein